jgi:hypothetical protein
MKRFNCRRHVRMLIYATLSVLVFSAVGAGAQNRPPEREQRDEQPMEQRGDDTQKRIADLKNRLSEARTSGQVAEAREIQQQLRQLRSQDLQPQPRQRFSPDRINRERPVRDDARNSELERRLQHIRIAVENLQRGRTA